MRNKIILLLSATFFITSCGVKQPTNSLASTQQQQQTGQLVSQASAGNRAAQYALAYRYYYGIGVRQDTDTAIHWMRLSKENGYPLAKTALPEILEARRHNYQHVRLRKAYYAPARPKVITPAPSNRHEYSNLLHESNPESHDDFTLGITKKKSRAAAEEFIQENELSGASVQAIKKGRETQYEVVSGKYKTMKEARENMRNLPEKVKKLHPSVKPLEE